MNASANANLYCVTRLGAAEGAKVIELIEATTGKPCPCKLTGQCPLALGRRRDAEVA